MSTNGTEEISPAVHRHVVERFDAGWRQPGPHAWDDLLADDVELHQPLMADGVGPGHWQEEFGRLQAFLPDLNGVIVDWAGDGDTVYVDIRCCATAGGRPLQFRAVDRLTVTSEGTIIRRDSFLDPTPLAAALLTWPTAWPAWWRSGVAPLARRRALLRAGTTGGTRAQRRPGRRRGVGLRGLLALGLGIIRSGVGVTALARPRLAYRSLGSRAGSAPVGGFLARAFGVRDLAIALATLSADQRTSRTGLWLGLLADTTDVASILVGRHHSGITTAGALLIGGPAAVFTTRWSTWREPPR